MRNDSCPGNALELPGYIARMEPANTADRERKIFAITRSSPDIPWTAATRNSSLLTNNSFIQFPKDSRTSRRLLCFARESSDFVACAFLKFRPGKTWDSMDLEPPRTLRFK